MRRARQPTARARRCSPCWSAGSVRSRGWRSPISFAGSGALGLEALSRGARTCTFVEQAPFAIRALRQNIAALKAQPQCDVRASSVLALGPAKAPLDLILLDPPYRSGAGEVALDKLVRLGWIGEATWVSLETEAGEEPRVRTLEALAERQVGKARITLLRLADPKTQAAPD